MYKYDSEKLYFKIFDLKHTFESAQPLTFYAHFDSKSKILSYPLNNQIVRIKHYGNATNGYLCNFSDTNRNIEDIKIRFRYQDRLIDIYKKINTDSFIDEGLNKYFGMRVTMNDPWESIIIFITSQFNNVKRIRQITMRLMQKFGNPIFDNNKQLVGYTFPSIASLANADEKEILACGAGFRAKYIKQSALMCKDNMDVYNLSKNYEKLKNQLMELDGVGDKVADCISLMGYGKLEAFPIDRWVKRVMERIYFKGADTKIDKIHEFAYDTWGNYAGYAQQYIFWNGRSIGMIK